MGQIICITTYYNSARYRSRLENYTAFSNALESQGVPLWTVELALGDDPFQLPERDAIIRVRGSSSMWMKERLINVAISRLPETCAGFAWLDSDLLWADRSWIAKLAEMLETHSVIQLFERVVHLPPGHRQFQGEHLGSDQGVAAQAAQRPDWLELRRHGKLPFAVPGYAWAARRSLFGDVGLYDRLILGNGDAFMTDCLFDSFGLYHYSSKRTAGMIADMDDWRRQFRPDHEVKVGYLPGMVYHLWHGTIANRRYCARDDILLRHDFDPRTDLVRSGDLYEWNSEKPGLHGDVARYFAARHEDGE